MQLQIFSVVIRRVVNVMSIVFVKVLRMSTALGCEFDSCLLRMSTALGCEFDECVARVEFGSAVDVSKYHRKNDLQNIDYESYLEDYLMNQIPQICFSFSNCTFQFVRK
jgi:hypothetical protein